MKSTLGPNLFAAALFVSICSICNAQDSGADVLGKGAWALLSPKAGADLTPGAGGVLRVNIHHPSPQYYGIQLTHDVAAAVGAGKSLVYAFSARSTTANPIHVVIEKRAAPYTHYLDETVILTPAWKSYSFTAKIPNAQAQRELAARIQVGQKAGTLEVKDIALGAK